MNLSYYYMKSVLKTWACCAGCAVLAVASAKANTTFDINSGNSALSGYSGPFATVEVSLVDSTHATVTFTALQGGGYQFLFGSENCAAMNINASGFTAVLSSFSQLGGLNFLTPSMIDTGGGNVSSFGTFNQTFKEGDGLQHATTTLTFSLTDNSGTWSDPADVLTPNTSGNSVASHIFVLSLPVTTNSTAVVTGFASDGGGSTTVPDSGATSLLLGAAVSALGLMRRKLS
jgi:hypothetical protein